MTHRAHQQTPACDRFDELLPDYLEGSLAAGARQEAERHRAACARCAELVADLQDVAHAAAALPRLRPDRDLWAGISERIEPAVVPLDARRVAAAHPESVRRPTYTFTRRWLGAAAAALVVVTSGVTYLAVRRDGAAPSADAARVVAAPAVAPAPAAPAPAATPAETIAAPAVVARGESPAERETRPAPSDARAASASGAEASLAAATATYDREIAALREVVRRQRADLDSGTVAVLERNLRIIDHAIAQSRAALARDPGSQFLGEQLTRALDSKVELLRTAALLPQRGA